MSALGLIQGFCRRHALNIPTSIVGDANAQVAQLRGILNQLLIEIASESKFNVLTQEAVFSLKPNEDQGALSSLAPNGYQWAIFETFFDRTLMLPLLGPLTESEWQQIKALPSTGPRYRFRIRGDHFLINPVPTTSLSDIAFEYVSNYTTFLHGNVLTPAAGVINDDDTFVFPEYILSRGLMFSWKQIKGLPYQADEVRFWEMLNNYIAKDKIKRRIDVTDPDSEIGPQVILAGSSH